jgi:hypothetical protein
MNVLKDGKELYLSKQEYDSLSNTQRDEIRAILTEAGHDPDLYETKMKALWPKTKVLPKTWRKT